MAVKVGLIGCGHIAQLVHARILSRLSEVELAAFADTDSWRREELRRIAPRALAFTQYQDLIDCPDLDAVVICLPNTLHAPVTLAALARGQHVYLEKPLAVNSSAAREVLAAWQCTGVVGMIGFNYRFNLLYQAARAHLQAGRLGHLVMARSVFALASPALPEWKKSRQNGGGVLLDLASHHIDLVRYLFAQEIGEVFATLESQRSEADTASLQLRLANGLLVQSFFSFNAVEEDRFEVYGQAGKLSVDRHLALDVKISDPTLESVRLKQLRQSLRSLRRSYYLLQKMRAPAYEPSYAAALAHFTEAITHGRPAKPDLADGYQSLAVIEAAEESARTGRVVSISKPAYESSAR